MKIVIMLFFLAGMLSNIHLLSAQSKPYDVIIIGAGIAGLAAARKLHDVEKNVLILEGDYRIGGRINTSVIDNTAVDLGASWIHGINGNPIYELAQSLNLRTKTTHYMNTRLFGKYGSELPAKDLEKIEGLITGFEQFCNKKQSSPQDTSLANVLTDYKKTISSQDHYLIDGLFTALYEQNCAAEGTQLSRNYYTGPAKRRPGDCDGEDVLVLDGYKKIVEHIADPFINDPYKTKKHLKLRSKIIAIAYDKETKLVTVTNENEETFQAPRVICTVPLGVLKKNIITFTPALPKEKIEAIRNLGMGVYNKVVLNFSSPFWSYVDTFSRNHYTYPQNEVDFIAQVGTSRRFDGFLNYYHYNYSNILVNACVGEAAREQEKLSDAEIVSNTVQRLRTLFPSLTPVIASKVTRWGSNPFSYGSYSYVPPGVSDTAYDDLAERVDGYLFFAGEATHRTHHSTVHGAYLSGLEAAMSVIHTTAMDIWLTAAKEGRTVFKNGILTITERKKDDSTTQQLLQIKQQLVSTKQAIERLDAKLKTLSSRRNRTRE